MQNIYLYITVLYLVWHILFWFLYFVPRNKLCFTINAYPAVVFQLLLGTLKLKSRISPEKLNFWMEISIIGGVIE